MHISTYTVFHAFYPSMQINTVEHCSRSSTRDHKIYIGQVWLYVDNVRNISIMSFKNN